MESMYQILFICTGNTCRSPMAKVIFNDLAAKRGLDYSADSAGLATIPGLPASPHAVAAVSEVGLDLSDHCSQPIMNLDLNRYRYFVALNRDHLDILRTLGIPDEMLRVLSGTQGEGIGDPFGGDLDTYRRCRDEITAAMEGLIASL